MPISAAAYTDDFYATDTKWNNLTNLNSLERGGSLDVHTKIVNTSGTPQMVNLIAGYYDDDGRLAKCQMYEIEVPEGEQTVDHSFEWDDVLLSANSEAKLFVFAENIRPLCDAVSLKYENQFDGFLGKKIYTCDFESDIDSAFKNYTIEKVGGSDALKIEGAGTIAVTGSILENSENVAISADFKQTNCNATTTGVISMGRLNYSGSNADRLCYIDLMNNPNNPVNKKNCFAFATSNMNSYDLSQNFDYKSFSDPADIYNKTDRSTDWFKMTMCYVGERVLCFADKLNGTSIWKTEQKSNSDIYLFDSMKYKSKGIFFASHCSDVYLDNIEAYEVMNISSLDINIPEKMMVDKWYDFDVTAIDKNLKVHTIDTNKLTFDYDESSLQIEGSKIKVLNLGATYIRAVLKDDIMSSETVGGVRVCGIEAADELSVYANKYVYLKDEPIEITVNAANNSKWFEVKGYELYCDDVKCENLDNIQSGHHTIKVFYGGIEAETEIYVSKYKELTCSFSNTAPSVDDSLTFTIYGDDGSGTAEITDYTVSYNKNAMQIEGNTITMKKAGVYKIDVKADSAEAQFEIECLAEDGAMLTEYFENSSDKNGYAPYDDNNIVTENGNRVLSLENSTTDIFGGKKWQNYTVSGRFKIENGSVDKNAYASGLEIVTRSNDASVLGSAHRNIRFIYNTDESKSSIRIGTIYGGETQAESYDWHNFEVSVNGYTAVFKVDGYEMMSSVSSSAVGGFYFLANNCRVSIDDLEFYKHTNESGDIKSYAVQTALNPYETYRVCDVAALRVGSNTFVNSSQITWAVADTTEAKIENGILTFDDDIQSESITIYASYNESVYPVTLNIAKPDSSKYEYTLSSVRVRQQSLAYKLSEDCDRSTINLATENLSYMHMLYAKMLIYPKLCDYSDALRWHIHEAQYQDAIVGRAISGGDFVMLQLAMACLELKDNLQATDDAWEDVKEYLTSVEYSPEGDNLSENHMLVNYATAILVSELWPDSEICSMSAQEAHSQFKAYFKNWYNNHISQGMMEYNSAHYYFIDLFALETLYTYSEDEEIRKLSSDMANYIYADGLDNSIGDDFGGAQDRVYMYDEAASRFKPYKLAFNIGNNVIDDKYAYINLQLVHTFTSTFRPIKLLYDEAFDSSRRYNNTEINPIYHLPYNLDYDGYLERYTHVTPNYVLGSKIFTYQPEAAEGVGLYNGHQEIPWSLRFGGKSTKMIIGGIPQSETVSSNEYWVGKYGNKDQFKLMQSDNVLIGIYKNDKSFVHFRIPKAEFKAVEEINGWIFINDGSTYAALKPMKNGVCDNSAAYEWSTSDAISLKRKLSESEIKVLDANVAFICEVADGEEYDGDFGSFKNDILTKTSVEYTLAADKNTLEYTSLKNMVIKIDYNADKRYINNVEYVTDNTILHNSPYMNAKVGAGEVKLTYGSQEYVIKKAN